MTAKRRPKIRWPFLVLFALALGSVLVMRWWSRRPHVVTATARPHRDSRTWPRAAGCDRSDSAAGTTTLEVDGRHVGVVAPAAPAEPRPVALLLHGWHSNGADFQRWFHFEQQTGDAAYVVYPDSDGPLWDVLGDRDLDFLEHVLDEVARAHCIDRSRVLTLGFSYGAKMAHHFGCKRPDRVLGIVAGGGDWVDGEPVCGADLPVLVLHRTHDPSELVDWGHDAARRWARVQGCDNRETPSELGAECTRFASCRPGGRVDYCEDTWFDPAWPHDWNHTVREPHRALAWGWFLALPKR